MKRLLIVMVVLLIASIDYTLADSVDEALEAYTAGYNHAAIAVSLNEGCESFTQPANEYEIGYNDACERN